MNVQELKRRASFCVRAWREVLAPRKPTNQRQVIQIVSEEPQYLLKDSWASRSTPVFDSAPVCLTNDRGTAPWTVDPAEGRTDRT